MFKRIVDTILGPVIEILTAARNHLEDVSLVAARGLNLDYYLGPVSGLGWQWRTLVFSVCASAALVLSILVARKIYSLYLGLKEGVKWW